MQGSKDDKRKRRPPGILQFTPTKDMPDTLYYQVKSMHFTSLTNQDTFK